MTGSIKSQFPGGCYLAFNWAIDRVSAARLIESVANAHVEGYEEVNILLSSTGGLLIDAHYLVETLVALPVRLVLWNVSAVQSAANMLYAIGTKRYVVPGATFFFHQTGFDGVAGQRLSEKEIRDQLRLIELGDDKSAKFVSHHTDITVETIATWQREGKTLSAEEAIVAGLAHGMQRPFIPQDAFVRQLPAA
jgi:ATP-dependent protease ClpP protease subunit